MRRSTRRGTTRSSVTVNIATSGQVQAAEDPERLDGIRLWPASRR